MNAIAVPLGRDLLVAPANPQLVLHRGASKITREQLALVPTPAGTATHRPVPHHEVVNQLEETLGFRHIAICRTEFAVSPDGAKMFGVLEIQEEFDGCRFALGIRNSHDKSMRLAMTIGYRVFVCDNLAFHGDFTPLLAKHSKHLNLLAALSVGVDQMHRNFGPMVKVVQEWRDTQITDAFAKLTIYRAFIEGQLEAPRHLDRCVHEFYFTPQHPDFAPRTLWSLSNAFTAAFKSLEPIPQFKVTARLGAFLNSE